MSQKLDQVVVFEVLREAISLAKGQQILSGDALKRELLSSRPDREAEVDAALRLWAARIGNQK